MSASSASAAASYRPVENWAKLPAGMSWGPTTSASTDAAGNVYVFRRAQPPILKLDASVKDPSGGRYLRDAAGRPTGVVVDNDELGGAAAHARFTGTASLVVPDRAAGLVAISQLLSFLPSNVDEEAPLRVILGALAEVGRQMPVVLPLHPRTRERMRCQALAISAWSPCGHPSASHTPCFHSICRGTFGQAARPSRCGFTACQMSM